MSDFTRLVIILFVVVPVCWVILYLIGRAIFGNPQEADTLREQHYNLSQQENTDESKLLSAALQYPFGSPQQEALMEQYKKLEAKNAAKWNKRVKEIVDR